MAQNQTYTTVGQTTTCEIVEKKSRFICNISHAETEQQAIDFVTKIKKQHYDAKHNVYAYILNDGTKKYTDDGEPSKTAGLPILDMLEKQGITDVVCVVTRYFGGILLGTGGLVRAYTDSAKLGVTESGIVTKELCSVMDFTLPYSQVGTMEHLLKNSGATIENKVFMQDVTISVYIKDEYAPSLIDKIGETFGTLVKISQKGQAYR